MSRRPIGFFGPPHPSWPSLVVVREVRVPSLSESLPPPSSRLCLGSQLASAAFQYLNEREKEWAWWPKLMATVGRWWHKVCPDFGAFRAS